MRIGILEPQDFSLQALENLKSTGELALFARDDLFNFIADKNVVFIRLAHKIDRNFLIHAPQLKYICTPTTGLNHIDLAACKERGIEVISLKGEDNFLTSIRATPEHTFGLVLALLRNYKTAVLSGANPDWERERHKGYELYDKTVGIIGLGRVGKLLTKYFKAFGCRVLFYDIKDVTYKKKYASKAANLDQLIIKSDIVILSASYSPENHEFFNRKYISLLAGKYFINTARGELVDEKYLIKKLGENFFAGVGLDVIQNEQQTNNLDQFLSLTARTNLVLTPHIAGATYNSMHKTEEFIVKKLTSVIMADVSCRSKNHE